jgi:uncharacterized protein (TIGR02147 family)
MSIFEFSEYRVFIKDSFQKMPRKGRGKSLELAAHLGTHATIVSQVLSGVRDFSEEQALEVCEFLQLSPIESDYFSLLVRHSVAGTAKLKAKLKSDLQKLKQTAKAISTRVSTERSLSDTERSVFYSSWIYAAARLYCSTKKEGRTLEEVAERFSISRQKAAEIIEFLERSGLCVRDDDTYAMGPQSTFVPQGSPYLLRHHTNWRLKAVQAAEVLSEEELMFTGVLSVSRADFILLREKMAGFIKEFSELVKGSPAEDVGCFNMDFFWLK